jgi:hypothetical protein
MFGKRETARDRATPRDNVEVRQGMTRRRVLMLAAVATIAGEAQAEAGSMTLLDIPLEVQGEWGKSPPRAAAAVIARMREASLAGPRLLSDRQPTRLRVENRTSGNPAIWLHSDAGAVAWIIVNVGGRDWSKLAYQFGHELGHVLANSWGPDSKPQNPCQWLEEALVEAFSLYGLGRLADSWEQRPVFANDAAFADAIRQYQRAAIERYETIASNQIRASRFDVWFRQNRSALENAGGLAGAAEAAVAMMLHELEGDIRRIEDLGALNRWHGRSAVPIERYMRLWETSCADIGAEGGLPKRLSNLLGVG